MQIVIRKKVLLLDIYVNCFSKILLLIGKSKTNRSGLEPGKRMNPPAFLIYLNFIMHLLTFHCYGEKIIKIATIN